MAEVEDFYIIAKPCPICKNVSEVTVPVEGYEAWKAGEFIQNALPTLNDDQREILMTGIDPKCWETLA